MRASLLQLALLLLVSATEAPSCWAFARPLPQPSSSEKAGSVAITPANRLLLQLSGSAGAAADGTAAIDDSAPAPEAEASGQACYDMRVNFGAACQVRQGVLADRHALLVGCFTSVQCRDGMQRAEPPGHTSLFKSSSPVLQQVGIDRVATYFPRGSTDPPTDEQVQDALQALQAGFLPSKG